MTKLVAALTFLLLVAFALGASLPNRDEIEPSLRLEGRIVGGYEVNIINYPHQVSMRRKACDTCAFAHSCGGSIYSENVIVTASHCVYGRHADNFTIVAGTSIRNAADGIVVRVAKIIMHEEYNNALYTNDIALMILASPLPLNGVSIAAIPLASQIPKQGSETIITGWGTTSSGGYSSDKLLAVKVPVVSNERCDAAYAAYYGPGRITDSMLCAGVEGVGGKDACQGDSGGPLVVNRELAGVVSWGIGCALANYPGVYANVAYLRDWILTNVAANT